MAPVQNKSPWLNEQSKLDGTEAAGAKAHGINRLFSGPSEGTTDTWIYPG